MSNFNQILEQLCEAVIVDLSQWTASTGKKQPGTQNRGMWIFTAGKNTDIDPKDEGKTYFVTKGSTLFSDAKKQAIAWAKEKGHIRIYVAP